MVLETFLKVIKGFNVVVIAGARATVHALLAAALLLFVTRLLGTILSLDLKSFFLWLLIASFIVFFFWIMLLIHGAREILLRTLVSEANGSSEKLSEKVLTPIAFALGSLLLFWLLVSQPVDFWRLLGENPLFLGLVMGYFLAPSLIRMKLLARLLEHSGSA